MSEFEKWYDGRTSFNRHITPKRAMGEAFKAGMLHAAEITAEVLQREIASKNKTISRFEHSGNMDSAAREDAVREGLSWALFVLNLTFYNEQEANGG